MIGIILAAGLSAATCADMREIDASLARTLRTQQETVAIQFRTQDNIERFQMETIGRITPEATAARRSVERGAAAVKEAKVARDIAHRSFIKECGK